MNVTLSAAPISFLPSIVAYRGAIRTLHKEIGHKQVTRILGIHFCAAKLNHYDFNYDWYS